MKILIFGSNGQVARELRRTCAVLGDVLAVGSDQVDFRQPEVLKNTIRELKPSHIINASAYTAVDKAEADEKTALLVNGEAVSVIAEEAKKIGAPFVHYSTDYVFDGSKKSSYLETDTPNPINAYGRSKLLGERLMAEASWGVVLRVSWVYGLHGQNFLKTMLRLGADREELKIVADQIGAPTWSRLIAEATAQIIAEKHLRDASGIYHMTPAGSCSWFDFAETIFKRYRAVYGHDSLKVRRCIPIPGSEYPTPAKRPVNSLMNSDKLLRTFGIKLPPWEESLDLCVKDFTGK